MSKSFLIGHGRADIYPTQYKSIDAAKRRARKISRVTDSVMGCNVYNSDLVMIAGYNNGKKTY